MINKKAMFCFFLIYTLTFTGCSMGTQNQVNENKTKTLEKDPIKEQVAKMSMEEKIGQLFIVGLEGYDIDDNSRKMIEEYHVGGFILFRDNIENSNQLLKLINSLKSANASNNIPLFISVDQEGGRVNRMSGEIKNFPDNKTIGRINNTSFSYKTGSTIAEIIKYFGFNMNFAPVLDINSNPQNPIIGDRSFGLNEKVVSGLGIQTMKGIQSVNIIPVVKHFPGHGDTSVDPHKSLPVVNKDLDKLKNFEFVPFKDAIDNNADAVMVAHILLNKVDPQNPASLSKTVVTDILRKQLNFSGVVLTDDMTMGAITKNFALGDAVVKAINAGEDIVLVCHGYGNEMAAMDAIKKAVGNETISEERIDESVYRVLKLKNKYNLTDNTTDTIDIKKINTRVDALLKAYYR